MEAPWKHEKKKRNTSGSFTFDTLCNRRYIVLLVCIYLFQLILRFIKVADTNEYLPYIHPVLLIFEKTFKYIWYNTNIVSSGTLTVGYVILMVIIGTAILMSYLYICIYIWFILKCLLKLCIYMSNWWGNGRPMVATCRFRSLLVLYRTLTIFT